MLREIYIFKSKLQIFKRAYGESISIQALSPILVSLIDFLKEAKENTIEFMNIINFKIAYATDIEHNLLFIFITDLTDDNDNIEQQLERLRSEFLQRYESVIDINLDPNTYSPFVEVSDEIFKELRPKIALVGFSGVGKTTITRLIRAEEIPVKHVPTITGDVATIKLGHINLYLWDFAGQEKYSFVWNKFIKGADSVILILDSSPKNVRESRFFIELIRKEEPHARIALVANKQDLPESMSAQEIEQYLGYKTYPMVAIDPRNRESMLNIIADTVKVRSLIEPFIKPLLQRDSLIAEAEAAIMAGNIQLAAEKFDQIAQLCIVLEEEDLMQHFKAQAQFLQSRLAELQQSVKIPTESIRSTSDPVETTESVIETITGINKEEKVVKKDKAEMEKILKEEEEKLKKEQEKPKKIEAEKIKEKIEVKEEEIIKKEEEVKKKKEKKLKKEQEKLEKLEKIEAEKIKEKAEAKEEEMVKKEEEVRMKKEKKIKKEQELKKEGEEEKLKKEQELKKGEEEEKLKKEQELKKEEEEEKLKKEQELKKEEEEEKLKKEQELKRKEEEEKLKKEQELKKKEEEERLKKEQEKKKKVEEEKLKKEQELKKKEEEDKIKKEQEKKKKAETERLKKEQEIKKKEEIGKKIEKEPVMLEKLPEMSEEVMQLNKEKENLQFKMNLLAKQYQKGELTETIFKNVVKKIEAQINEIDVKIGKFNAK